MVCLPKQGNEKEGRSVDFLFIFLFFFREEKTLWEENMIEFLFWKHNKLFT